jgi:hypothetical protein
MRMGPSVLGANCRKDTVGATRSSTTRAMNMSFGILALWEELGVMIEQRP